MSGLEILGIAANVVQIADLGARLSVKLFAFSRRIKNANRSIEAISRDIAATGAVLQQLGTQLNKDQNARLCSDEAITTARELVTDCQRLFQDTERAIEPMRPGQKANWLQRAKFPFLDLHIESLRCNLERLKSSLMLMLNTLILVGQMRNHEALQTLTDQRELILLLVGDARDSKERFEQSKKLVKKRQPDPVTEPGAAKIYSLSTASTLNNSTCCRELEYRDDSVPQSSSTNETAETAQPKDDVAAFGFEYRKQGLLDHCALIKRLLLEIEARKYKIDHSLRSEMCTVVLDFHWNHWLPLRKIYGLHTLLEAMSQDHPEVAVFWASQDKKAIREPNLVGNHACPCYGCEKAFERLGLLQRHQERHDLETQYDGIDTHQRHPSQVSLSSDRTSATKSSPRFLGFSMPSIVNPRSHEETLYRTNIYAFHHASSQIAHSFVPTLVSEGSALYETSESTCADYLTQFTQGNRIASPPSISEFSPGKTSPLTSSKMPGWEPLVIPTILPPSVPEETNHPMKCICTYTDDDGNLVLCRRCETWQHVECFYPDKNVPEVHFCADCEPKFLDAEGVKARQHPLRSHHNVGGARSKSAASKSHGKKTKPPSRIEERGCTPHSTTTTSFYNILMDPNVRVDPSQRPPGMRLHGRNVLEPRTVEARNSFEDALRLPAQPEVETDIVDQLILQYTVLTGADLCQLKTSIQGRSDTDPEQERLQQPLMPRDESVGLANMIRNELEASDELEESFLPRKCSRGIATDLKSPVVDADAPPALVDSAARRSRQETHDGRTPIVYAPFRRRTKRRRDSLEAMGSDQHVDHYPITRHAEVQAMSAEYVLAHERRLAEREDNAREKQPRYYERQVRAEAGRGVRATRPRKRRGQASINELAAEEVIVVTVD